MLFCTLTPYLPYPQKPAPANDYEIPWANHAAVCVRHDDPAWTTAQQWRAAMETTTVAATALNVTASLCK
jgi:hypothetical protein